MYGNHVMKSGLGRITENTPAYTGVVIYSMSDIPLGFGVTAKSTADCRKMDPSGIVVFHQADVGELSISNAYNAWQFLLFWLCVHVKAVLWLQVSTSETRMSCDAWTSSVQVLSQYKFWGSTPIL